MAVREDMIERICAEIKNYFNSCIIADSFEIVDGVLDLPDCVQDGQYFRIIGSIFNDGVYKAPSSGLVDECFDGAVWAMAVPPAVVDLAAEIEAWNQSGAAKPSAYTSESFGGYSYTKGTRSNGTPITWVDVFADRLKEYKRAKVL